MFKIVWEEDGMSGTYDNIPSRKEADSLFDKLIERGKGVLTMYDGIYIVRTYPTIPENMSFKATLRTNGPYGLRINVPSEVVRDMMLELGEEVKVTIERYS